MRRIATFLALTAALAFPFKPAGAAGNGCTLVTDHKTGNILYEDGDCKTQHPPQSTFKIPLALMGFDSGILKDPHTPTWNYLPEYQANREEERADTDPARWEKESIVWFSQNLTRQLGMQSFESYVKKLAYGNMDISGDTGKYNGLTHSWLSSSLKISPAQQVAFINNLLKRSYPLSPNAYDRTMEIVPTFETHGWKVHGKTGTGYARTEDGKVNKDISNGWFVGWAENHGRIVSFAKYVTGKPQTGTYAGPRARDEFLKQLPEIMADARPNSK